MKSRLIAVAIHKRAICGNDRFARLCRKALLLKRKEFADSSGLVGGRPEAAMGPRRIDQAVLFYEFSLERHVPATHLQRAIEPHIPVFDKSARDDGGDFDYNQEADIYVCDLHRHSRERWG